MDVTNLSVLTKGRYKLIPSPNKEQYIRWIRCHINTITCLDNGYNRTVYKFLLKPASYLMYEEKKRTNL